MHKRLFLIGIIPYFILLFFAVLFYKERAILVDSAYDVFYLLQGNNFDLNVSRFGGIITKFIPFFAVKAGMPFNDVLISYSLSYVIYYFSCYLMCGFLFRQYALALVVLLSNILFVSHAFYYIPSELPQGIAFFCVVLAGILALQKKNKAISIVVIIGLSCLLAFFHPLLLFVIAYTTCFFAMRQWTIPKPALVLVVSAFLVSLLLKGVLLKAQYEQHALGGLKNFITLFPDYFSLYANKLLLSNFAARYYWIPVLTILIGFYYFKTGEHKKMIFTLVSVIGYIFLINVTFYSNATPDFYIENQYLPVSVFLALPFLYDVLPAYTYRAAMLVFILIIVSGCIRVYVSHMAFTNRLNVERDIIKQYQGKKVVLDARRVNTGRLQIIWGTPYELLLLSMSDHMLPASIIVEDKPDENLWMKGLSNALRVNWATIPYSSLNKTYFHFTDTVTEYTIIK